MARRPALANRKIHYLTGVAYEGPDGVVGGERLTLEAGEYAVVHVNDTALLRDTWTWLLGHWLASSGRREKSAPEFERFTSISEAGTPIGPVEFRLYLRQLSAIRGALSGLRVIRSESAKTWRKHLSLLVHGDFGKDACHQRHSRRPECSGAGESATPTWRSVNSSAVPNPYCTREIGKLYILSGPPRPFKLD